MQVRKTHTVTSYGAISPFRGLEIGGRITEVLGVEAFEEFGTYGNFRDKSVDIKYQFLSERKYLPALAFGIMDPSGTRSISVPVSGGNQADLPLRFYRWIR